MKATSGKARYPFDSSSTNKRKEQLKKVESSLRNLIEGSWKCLTKSLSYMILARAKCPFMGHGEFA